MEGGVTTPQRVAAVIREAAAEARRDALQEAHDIAKSFSVPVEDKTADAIADRIHALIAK